MAPMSITIYLNEEDKSAPSNLSFGFTQQIFPSPEKSSSKLPITLHSYYKLS